MKFVNSLSKQLLVGGLVALAMLLLGVLVVVKAKAMSYAKIEPYTLVLNLEAEPQSTVFLAYDYGFGIQDQHIRRLIPNAGKPVPNEDKARFEFSISAWKHIHALYIFAPKDNPPKVSDLVVSKNGVEYQPVLPVDGPTLEGDNWMYRLPLTDFKYR